jgi:signal transduction histidine kinase
MHRAAQTRLSSAPDQPSESVQSSLSRYALALFVVIAALVISFALREEIYAMPLFFVAVAISCWYGGIGPGVVAIFASAAAINYFFEEPRFHLAPDWHDIPRLMEFMLIAAAVNLITAARKRAEQVLRQAHDELETRVRERTAELQESNRRLQQEIIQRRAAEEALRTSEQLARSHVDVMMRSLDVLATEAAPEKFIGEMLKTIGQHLCARRVTFWLRNKEDDSLRLRVVIEGGQQVEPHLEHPWVLNPNSWKTNPLVQEMLFTKAPVVCDDIEHDARITPEDRRYLTSKASKRFMLIPLSMMGELSGFIGIQHGAEASTYRAEEIELAQALAHHVMIAAHTQQLGEQRRQAAILEERTRMARDIHDTLAQGFTGLVVQMEAAEEALLEEDPEQAVRHVRRARALAREGLNEARRSVHALRPQALERGAFADALKAIINNTAAGTALSADFLLEGEPRELKAIVEENLLHILQEAFTNVLKHARATEFQARLSFDTEAVRLELRDNGIGFDVATVNSSGFGLIGMKERADQIGATLEVASKPGAGTKITAVSRYQAVARVNEK